CSGTWPTWSLLVFFYNFVDNVVPAKLGDIYGAHLAWINLGIARATALGSIMCLRMVDTWVVLLLAVSASWWLFAASWPSAVRWGLFGGDLLAVGITGLVLGSGLVHRAPPSWLPATLYHRIRAVYQGVWPPTCQWALIGILTVVLWALETLAILSLMWAFNVDTGPVHGIFVTTLP